jgi:hypothetical protein
MPRVDLPFALPGYRLTGLLGFGGTGEVWRAIDEGTAHPVVLKRLWEPAGPELLTRLNRDAMLLDHAAGRHAVALHEIAQLDNGEVVLVLEYAAGGSLAGLLSRRGRLHPAEVVTVIGPLARVLGNAHGNGLWHGNLSPSNVVFGADGRPKLSDFGLALATGERPSDDPVYRDPALSAGWAPGPASDVFGLATLGYAALTGVPPRPTDAMGRVPAIAELAPSVPAALASAVEAAMAPDPDARPDAATLAAAVLRSCSAAPVRLVEHRGTTTSPEREPAGRGGRHRAHRRARRRPRRLALTTVVFASVGLSALTGAGWARLGQSPAAAVPASEVDVAAPAAAPAPAPSPKPAPWPRIVAHLDFLRAQAWLAGDPTLLSKVYEPTATGVDLDRAELGVLAARSLRARGFTATVEQATELSSDAGVVTLRVVDRISGYTVVNSNGEVVASRPGRTQTYRMTIERVSGTWLVKAIA